MSEQNNKPEEFESDLVGVIKRLYRNRKLISLIIVSFLILGLIYAFSITKTYKATLTMYPATGESSKMSGLAGMASSFGLDLGVGAKETYNIEDIIKSRTIAKEIILHKWKTSKFSKPVDLLGFDGIEIKDSAKAIYGAVKVYSSIISIETNKETGLLKLNVETEDPILSAEIANYLGKAVTEYVQNTEGEKEKRNISHILQRLNEVSKELHDAEEAELYFKINNRDLFSPQAKLEVDRLARVQEIKQGVYLTLVKQKEVSEIEIIKKSAVINILDKAEVPLYKDKPKRSLIILMFTFMGGFIGILFVLIMPFVKVFFSDFKLAKFVKD